MENNGKQLSLALIILFTAGIFSLILFSVGYECLIRLLRLLASAIILAAILTVLAIGVVRRIPPIMARKRGKKE
jgi:uncharacterized membrane protein